MTGTEHQAPCVLTVRPIPNNVTPWQATCSVHGATMLAGVTAAEAFAHGKTHVADIEAKIEAGLLGAAS